MIGGKRQIRTKRTEKMKRKGENVSASASLHIQAKRGKICNFDGLILLALSHLVGSTLHTINKCYSSMKFLCLSNAFVIRCKYIHRRKFSAGLVISPIFSDQGYQIVHFYQKSFKTPLAFGSFKIVKSLVSKLIKFG